MKNGMNAKKGSAKISKHQLCLDLMDDLLDTHNLPFQSFK
jgi:hypothetical protein